jgi:hypothetical protein
MFQQNKVFIHDKVNSIKLNKIKKHAIEVQNKVFIYSKTNNIKLRSTTTGGLDSKMIDDILVMILAIIIWMRMTWSGWFLVMKHTTRLYDLHTLHHHLHVSFHLYRQILRDFT